ncbi:hypothetical protein AURDEDRAFT_124862 [Auricularia subglabra TFB-10046 SS5]|nr:hypothetical protein AURDEDRAFT_124862 [Auricularia subglabra TFB-10046 SS5]
MPSAANGAPSGAEEAPLLHLRLALEAAISKAGGLASLDATDGVVANIARALVDRNSRAARHVPRELWLYVWQYLPFVDMVAAARVCRSWRTLARAAPELWTIVEIHSSLHHQDCDCEECEESLSCAGDTNLGIARYALASLSRDKSVAVQLRSTRSQENEIFESQLIRTLTQCASRLVELRIACNDERLPSSILRGVGAFPALETLTIRSIDRWGLEEPPAFAGSSVELPALAYLDLDPSCVWPEMIDQVNLQALRSLTCTFHSPYEVIIALVAFSIATYQNVRLHWRLDPREPDLFDLEHPLPDYLDAINVVRISNLTAAHEARALELFARDRRECLALEYIDSAIALGFQACQHLDAEGGLELRCLFIDGRVDITVADTSLSEMVEISFPPEARTRTAIDWHAVPGALSSLVVDAALWEDVLRDLPAAPRVAKITLNIVDALCLECVRRADGLPPQTFAPGLLLVLEGKRRSIRPIRVTQSSVERVRVLLGATAVSLEGIAFDDE